MVESIAGSISNLQGTDLLTALFLIAIMVALKVPESNITKKTRVKVIKWLMVAMGFSIVISVWLRVFYA